MTHTITNFDDYISFDKGFHIKGNWIVTIDEKNERFHSWTEASLEILNALDENKIVLKRD